MAEKTGKSNEIQEAINKFEEADIDEARLKKLFNKYGDKMSSLIRDSEATIGESGLEKQVQEGEEGEEADASSPASLEAETVADASVEAGQGPIVGVRRKRSRRKAVRGRVRRRRRVARVRKRRTRGHRRFPGRRVIIRSVPAGGRRVRRRIFRRRRPRRINQRVRPSRRRSVIRPASIGKFVVPAIIPVMNHDQNAKKIFNTALPGIVPKLQQISAIVQKYLYGSNPSAAPDKLKLQFELGSFGTGGPGSSFAKAITAGTNGRITFSTEYTKNFKGINSLKYFKENAFGTLVHEMTHIYQNYGLSRYGRAPQPLIEGIADFVQIATGYGELYESENQSRLPGNHWLEGYYITAKFLQYIDRNVKSNFVISLNRMMANGYSEAYFQRLTGRSVNDLWAMYVRTYRN